MAYFKLTLRIWWLSMMTWMCAMAPQAHEAGGPGGHRGILDIIATLNTEEFLRVKLASGAPFRLPTEKYVLSHFPAEDAENVAQLIERAAQAVVMLLGKDWPRPKPASTARRLI